MKNMKTALSAEYVESVQPTDSFNIHYHEDYEFYFFLDGEADYHVNGKIYHLVPNSIILLSPYVLHGVHVKSDKPYKRYFIHFDINCIRDTYRPVIQSLFPESKFYTMGEVYFPDIQDKAIIHFCNALLNASKKHNSIGEDFTPLFLESLLAQFTLTCSSMKRTKEYHISNKAVQDVIRYINSHLNEKISLTLLSELFFLNKDHLNRLFHKVMGTTVQKYISHQRILYAEQLLSRGVLASEAAVASGFGDYSSFYRAYKNVTGHSPKEQKRET